MSAPFDRARVDRLLSWLEVFKEKDMAGHYTPDEANAEFIAAASCMVQQLRAASERIAQLEKALKGILWDCDNCFYRCEHCGHQDDIKDMDLCGLARAALRRR